MQNSNQITGSVMIVAGEASGDLHGAGLIRAMQKKAPGLQYFGMGGRELSSANVEMVCDADDVAVMGLTEVLSNLREIFKSLKILKEQMRERKPCLLVLIDFADFNLRLAKEAKKLNIPVFYYITPKVWVWRKRRVRKLAKFTDTAGVILPFEENYLKNRGVNAKYVGNPVFDSVTTKYDKVNFCRKHNIDTDKALVGILPGSRKKEIAFLLPVFLEAARRMQMKYSREIVFLIPLASTLNENDLNESGLKEYKRDLEIHVLAEDKYEMMAACDGVVAASGTVTLELAVLDVPMVVAYKFTPMSYFIGKLLINIPYFSLVNILADKEVVTELLQDQVHPATVELELARILFDDNVKRFMKDEFAKIRSSLGKPGVSLKAADLALKTLKN